jgi:hypothetical protein
MPCFYGDITGHFWLGIHTVFEELGATEEPMTIFHGCGCLCKVDEHNVETLYCMDCYESFPKHIDDAPDSVNGLTWYVKQDIVSYRFDKTDTYTIQDIVTNLFTYIGEYTESFTLIEEEHTIQYDFRLPDGLETEDMIQLGIWCVGKLVLRSLEKNGKCHVMAEI